MSNPISQTEITRGYIYKNPDGDSVFTTSKEEADQHHSIPAIRHEWTCPVCGHLNVYETVQGSADRLLLKTSCDSRRCSAPFMVRVNT